MDKPYDINRFAMLVVAACLLNVVATLIVMRGAQDGLLGAGLGAAISIGLVLWIVRRRSGIGRILLTIWAGLSIAMALAGYAAILFGHRGTSMTPLLFVLNLLTLLLNGLGLFFLWSRPSSLWLRGRSSAAS